MKQPAAEQLGTLQSWNDERGFGFIRPNTGGEDVFVHIKDFVNRSSRPKVGDVLVYRLGPGRDDKLKAIDARIQWDAQPSKPASKKAAWLSGELRSWDDEKGYGFIVPARGGPDVFIHITDFKHDDYRPIAGGKILYRLSQDSSGKQRACDAIMKDEEYTIQEARTTLSVWVIALLPFVLSAYVFVQLHSPIFFLVYASMSLLAFLMYAEDKGKAKKGQWRTQEDALHFIELCGGWPGALLAQSVIRHKSQKLPYQTTFWTIVIIHLLGWGYAIATDKIALASTLPTG
jgi:cold shock CspA family protein/uncharacterized membrane protein YsdA (DUF1294 family)